MLVQGEREQSLRVMFCERIANLERRSNGEDGLMRSVSLLSEKKRIDN